MHAPVVKNSKAMAHTNSTTSATQIVIPAVSKDSPPIPMELSTNVMPKATGSYVLFAGARKTIPPTNPALPPLPQPPKPAPSAVMR